MNRVVKEAQRECRDARAIMWRAQARMRVVLQQEIRNTVTSLAKSMPDTTVMFVCTSDLITFYIGEAENPQHDIVKLCYGMRTRFGDCCPVCIVTGLNDALNEQLF